MAMMHVQCTGLGGTPEELRAKYTLDACFSFLFFLVSRYSLNGSGVWYFGIGTAWFLLGCVVSGLG